MCIGPNIMEGSSVVSVPAPVAVVPAMSPLVSAGASAPVSQEEVPPPPASSQGVTAPQITALVQVQPTATNAPATALALAAPTPLDLHASPQPTKLNMLKGRC